MLSIIVVGLFASSLVTPVFAMSTKAAKSLGVASGSARAIVVIPTDRHIRTFPEKPAETGPGGDDWGHCWYFTNYTECENYGDNGQATNGCTWYWNSDNQAYDAPECWPS